MLFVLHAVWLRSAQGGGPGRVALWTEDSAAAAPARRPGRAPRVQVHPFAAKHEQLLDVLPRLAGAELTTATLSLPGRGALPVDSPELVRDDLVGSSAALTYRKWTVPIAVLDVDRAVVTLPGVTTDAVVVSASVTHIVDLARFAADLVERGRVLPGVEVDPPRAIWRPVLTGPDAAWAQSLAHCMPPALTAAEPARGLEVWADALDSLVDASARAALGTSKLHAGRAGDATTRAWLAALTASERTFAAGPREAQALAHALDEWQQDALAGPVRACFRLVEPTGDDEVWTVRFALQATDESALIVDAEAVWRARGTLPALARRLDSPQETMLAELGKAGRVYPELDAALHVARPSELTLNTTGAHRFLSVAAPALVTADFGVQLPGWWTKPSTRLGVRLTVHTPAQPGRVAGAASQVGTDSIAEFRHDLALGGEILSAAELAELSDLATPMVRLRGQWIELDVRRLAAGLKLHPQSG